MTEFTYRQFDEAMRALGFVVCDADDDTRVYNHPGTGALYMTPIFAPDDAVLMRHLMGAKLTIESYGVATSSEFDARLKQAG